MKVFFLDGPADGQMLDCADGTTHKDFIEHSIEQISLREEDGLQPVPFETIRYSFHMIKLRKNTHWFGILSGTDIEEFDLIQHLMEAYKQP